MAPAAVWEIVSNPDPSLDDNRTDNTKLRLGVGGGGDSGRESHLAYMVELPLPFEVLIR
jgi:hypothetical protein